jgi:Cd2+/Zn2+-exporting ATPase
VAVRTDSTLSLPSAVAARRHLAARHRPALLTAATLVMLLAGVAFSRAELEVPAHLCYMLAYVFGGYTASRAAWHALRVRRIDVNLLMLLSALGAAVLDAWDEGAVLLFLFSLSNTLEYYAMARTRRAIEALMKLRPDRALVRRPGGEALVRVEDVAVGELVVIRPAERVPLDGRVTAGTSDIDQGPITGESVPVMRTPGDDVFAGTINGSGLLEVEVTRPAGESTLARIIRMVAEAQSQRAPTQRLIDRIGQPYAIGVMVASAAVAVALPLLWRWPVAEAFYRAMTLLVVASPCALVISTPASLLSGIANAARAGVLFKGGAALETLAAVRTVIFDKTGTLTRGALAVTDVVPFDGVDRAAVLAAAASAEQRSEHHLARAIVAAAAADGIAVQLPEAFRGVPGRGVVASVNGTEVVVGALDLVAATLAAIPAAARATTERLEAEGKTVVLVATGRALGVLALADVIRDEAPAVVAALRRLGVQDIGIITGDNERVAGAVAARLDIRHVEARLLPEAKVAVIRRLRERGRTVAMVGDGVNDAPALATSHVGVAMGRSGTDAALETADVVLMHDDLRRLVYAMALARRARAVVLQNLTFATLVIVGLVTAALFGGLRLALGVVGHETSTVIVVLNGLRLLRYRPPRTLIPPGLPEAGALPKEKPASVLK